MQEMNNANPTSGQTYLSTFPVNTPFIISNYDQGQYKLCMMPALYIYQPLQPQYMLFNHGAHNMSQLPPVLQKQPETKTCTEEKIFIQTQTSQQTKITEPKQNQIVLQVSNQESEPEDVGSEYDPLDSKDANSLKRGRGVLWSDEEIKLLIKLYQQNDGDWRKIVTHFSGRSISQCSQKFRKVMKDKYKKKKNKWSQEEDLKLLELIAKLGKDWGMIAENFSERTQKQVRSRYINKLDPNLSDRPWSNEEDDRLLQLFELHGKRWTKFSKEFGNRSENQIKNRFYYCIKKRLCTQTAKTKIDDQD